MKLECESEKKKKLIHILKKVFTVRSAWDLQGNKWNPMEQKNEMLKTYVMFTSRKACNKVKSLNVFLK